MRLEVDQVVGPSELRPGCAGDLNGAGYDCHVGDGAVRLVVVVITQGASIWEGGFDEVLGSAVHA